MKCHIARRTRVVVALAVGSLLSASRPAGSVDLLDGKIEIHGFVEEQVRGVARNFNANDGWDLTQWYNVLSVETDLNLFPDGVGPFDLVSGFMRLEARFDCVWYHGCGMFPTVETYGNSASKLPGRISGARSSGYSGTLWSGDDRRLQNIPVDRLGYADKDLPYAGHHVPAYIWHAPGVNTLFGVPGSDGVIGTEDDPAFYVFGRYVEPGEEYRFGMRKIRDQPNRAGLQVIGPYLPENKISPLGAIRDVANPFSPLDFNPTSNAVGATAMPYRPYPLYPAAGPAPRGAARGLFIPNESVARLMEKNEFDDFDQNFSQSELAWNMGASQQDERELKEAYLDLEMFDSRLWIRAGKQNIVWGKTELFRTTDQFNPQDLALATLGSLEETRIALWALRAVYSFYTVGPLEDLRLEVAANFDQMEPTDLGRCGEPYTPNPVCYKTAGLFAHGIAGSALAGEIRPPDPWQDVSGLEFGARLEFRWDRYSFAFSDFWGYDDFPYVDPVFYYERNVDPRTGRPRSAQSREDCDPDDLFGGNTSGCLSAEDALRNHHANQQRFALITGSSIGFSDLDPAVGAQSVLNSASTAVLPFASVAEILGYLFTGSPGSKNTALNFLVIDAAGTRAPIYPTVFLNVDPGDGPGQGAFRRDSLSARLSPQQQALLGCGSFWNTSCDVSTPDAYGGIDLLNAELSVMAQSWPGFPGTVSNRNDAPWLATAGPGGPIQPGTIRWCGTNPGAPGCNGGTGWVAFGGGAVARRFEDGQAFTLPGARSPFPEAGELRLGPTAFDASVDGCVSGILGHPGCTGPKNELVHPFSGDYFQSELAAFSWNFLITFAALSGFGKTATSACPPGTPSSAAENCFVSSDFIPADSFRQDGCSYARLELCSNVSALFSIAHTTRKSVRAGGNGNFGRTDFDWHQGGSGVLRYEKRNVLGFSMDFAEDATKSNWGIESTWIEGNPFEDNDEYDRLRSSDTFNLTVSVDRPTFINFLNKGRTFFFNTQWFFQYIGGYHDSYTVPGPWNVLATFHVDTGYFRDRLLPGITLVYDFQSQSGAILPEIAYRFTENLSVTMSMNLFSGRFQRSTPALRSIGDFPYRAGKDQNTDWTEQGISPVRDLDEVALRLRYTF